MAAVVMAMLAAMISAARGAGLSEPALIAATFFGDAAASRPVASAVVGVLTHVLVGATLGAIFAAITRTIRSKAALLAAGLAYAAAVFLVMTFALLPVVNPAMAATVEPARFFVYHLAFGIVLPIALMMRMPRFQPEGDPHRPSA